MSHVRIYLLGPPRIEIEDQPIQVDTRKAIALLAYIAVTQTRHRRESLVNLLWPDFNQSRGRTNLRRTLYALRKSLQGPWLDVDREEIGLDFNTDIWLDVNHFYQILSRCRDHGHLVSQGCLECTPSLSDAVKLYRGDFLDGFSLRDTQNFDEWQITQAESLRRELSGALEGLVNSHLMQTRIEPAIQYANRWLILDPLNESAHCRLMQLYALSGQRSSIRRQYETCTKLLRDDLDLPPQPSTTNLYKNLMAESESPAHIIQDQILPTSRQGWPQKPVRQVTSIISRSPGMPGKVKGVFVGRDRELDLLNEHLVDVLNGNGHPVFITGGAGQGKSFLIQESASRFQEHHLDLLYALGNCNAHTGIGDPYLPFRQILSLLTGDVDAMWTAGAISQNHAQRLWDVFPFVIENLVEFGPDLIDTIVSAIPLKRRATAYMTGGLSEGLDWLTRLKELVTLKSESLHDPNLQQTALFEQYTQTMIALERGYPLLLVLDDLQWADIGSISLLFHLGRRLEGHRIMIVGAYRPEELVSGRGEQRHPLDRVINEFQLAYGDITIDLERSGKRHFVEVYLDSEPNRLGSQFRQMLYHQTKGHPLFTVEFLRGMQDRGDIIQDKEGCWVEGQILDWETLPTRIEAVIAERIGRLDDRSKEVLRIASVEGEIFTAEVLAGVLSMDQMSMIDNLSNKLERQHRLVSAQEIQRLGTRRLSRYRFRHILFQSYLYQSLDQVERVYLHEIIGKSLEELYGEDVQDIAPALARHFQEAALPQKALEYLFLSGEKAKRSSAHEAAITHLNKGLELLRELPVSPQRDLDELNFYLALGIPMVLTKGHSTPEVEGIYNRAREICQQLGEDPQHFQALLGLRRYYLHQGALVKARQLSEQLIELSYQMNDDIYISRAHMMQIEMLYRQGEFTQIHQHYQGGMAHFQPNQSPTHIFLFGNDTGVGCRIFETLALWYLGFPEKALKGAVNFLEIARELSHPFTLVFSLYFISNLFQLCRDVESVQRVASELLKIAQERGFSMYVAWGTVLQGWVLVENNQTEAGIHHMEQGIGDWRDMGASLLLPNFYVNLAEAYQRAGRTEAGLNALEDALEIVEETGERTFEPEIYRIKGELLRLNNIEGAEACFQKAIQKARYLDAKAWELRAVTSLYRFHLEGDRLAPTGDALQEIYDSYEEGFDLPDLADARNLLNAGKLNCQTDSH